MVKIKNHLTNKLYKRYINRQIESLLKYVPQRDLVGIERIVIYDNPSKAIEEYAGRYHPKYGKELAYIEIAVNSVFVKKPVLMFVPFLGRFILATVLYHEIGHHCHHSFKHGVKKSKRENFAEKYKEKMQVKALRRWLLLLRPLGPLVRYMAKRT